MIEGEEESGVSHLPEVLEKLKKRIGKVDLVVLSDTPSETADRLTVMSGVRGIMAFDLNLRGIARDLHSGNGGPIPNAIRELTRVLGGLFDAQGWVNIQGFYDDALPISKAELSAIKKARSAKEFARQIGARGYYPVHGKSPFEVNSFFPSFEINGIFGGYQGEGSKTIIPAEATAKITCRIAAGQDPHKLQAIVFKALKSRINAKLFDFQITPHGDPKAAYAMSLTHPSPILKRALESVNAACKAVTCHAPFYMREGGSIPILLAFKEILGADSLMLGLFNEDSLLHSPNENIRLKLLENGTKVWERVFSSL